MQPLSNELRYGSVAQTFHWLTVALVAAAYVISSGGPEERVYSAAADFTRTLHETLGLAVFAVVLLRMLWRALDPAPEPPPMEPWMERFAKLVQLALYALLVIVPATAILGAWLEGHPLTLLGGVRIDPLLPEAHATGRALARVHTFLGNTLIWLAGLHAAAALYHHYFLRDRVLASMLPGRWSSPVLSPNDDPGAEG